MRACSQPGDVRPAWRRSTLAVLGTWLLAACAVAPGATEAGNCPASIVDVERYDPTDPFAIDAFVFDSTITFGPSSAHIQFDRTQGQVAFSAGSSGRLLASLRIVEAIDVVGVPSGTPVEARIEFRLDGSSEQSCGGSGCGVLFEGKLVAATDSVEVNGNHNGPTLGPRPLAGTLSLPVHFVAGTPIEVQFFVRFGTGPGGGASASAIGSYHVTGLPAGARAIACPGVDVTPALRPTWGRLKSLYR